MKRLFQQRRIWMGALALAAAAFWFGYGQRALTDWKSERVIQRFREKGQPVTEAEASQQQTYPSDVALQEDWQRVFDRVPDIRRLSLHAFAPSYLEEEQAAGLRQEREEAERNGFNLAFSTVFRTNGWVVPPPPNLRVVNGVAIAVYDGKHSKLRDYLSEQAVLAFHEGRPAEALEHIYVMRLFMDAMMGTPRGAGPSLALDGAELACELIAREFRDGREFNAASLDQIERIIDLPIVSHEDLIRHAKWYVAFKVSAYERGERVPGYPMGEKGTIFWSKDRLRFLRWADAQLSLAEHWDHSSASQILKLLAEIHQVNTAPPSKYDQWLERLLKKAPAKTGRYSAAFADGIAQNIIRARNIRAMQNVLRATVAVERKRLAGERLPSRLEDFGLDAASLVDPLTGRALHWEQFEQGPFCYRITTNRDELSSARQRLRGTFMEKVCRDFTIEKPRLKEGESMKEYLWRAFGHRKPGE